MLKLKPLRQPSKAKHLDLMRDRFYQKLAPQVFNLDATSQLLMEYLEDHLQEILIGDPLKLDAIVRDVTAKFPAFTDYAARRIKGTDPADDPLRSALALINSCFDYDWFSSRTIGWGAYELVKCYASRICPYCHAHHVNYHFEPRGGQAKPFKFRPPLDHYLPKSKYPYLAVSLNNLIPCCVQCNSGVKISSDPFGKGLAHPLDHVAVAVRFSIAGTLPKKLNGKIDADDIKLTLSGTGKTSTDHITEFRLKERYEWYRHEIKDLIDRHAEHRDLSTSLKKLIPRELYVLGFLEAHAEDRSIGLCLRDIYRELKS